MTIGIDLNESLDYTMTIDSIRDGKSMAVKRAVKSMKDENNVIDASNYISLKQFPPKLRKLAKYLLESEKPVTIVEACEHLKLNIDSINSMITRCRRNGNDFSEFMNEQAQSLLKNNRVGVYRAVVNGAVSDSSTAHNQQRLFTLLVGDTKESTNINIGALTVGVNISALPVQDPRDKGIIDIEPFIPKGK